MRVSRFSFFLFTPSQGVDKSLCNSLLGVKTFGFFPSPPMERRRNGSWRVLFCCNNDCFQLFVMLSLGEDRCEGENDKVFTRSALIKSDLWRAGEEVKAKKENQLRRAYVRARRADCVKVLVSDRSSCAKWGRGEGKSPVCSRVLHKAFALPGTLPSGHHGVRFPFLFGALRCGGDCEGAGLSTLPRREAPRFTRSTGGRRR